LAISTTAGVLVDCNRQMKQKQAYCRRWQVTVNDEPSGRSFRDSYRHQQTPLNKTHKSMTLCHSKTTTIALPGSLRVTLGQQHQTSRVTDCLRHADIWTAPSQN